MSKFYTCKILSMLFSTNVTIDYTLNKMSLTLFTTGFSFLTHALNLILKCNCLYIFCNSFSPMFHQRVTYIFIFHYVSKILLLCATILFNKIKYKKMRYSNIIFILQLRYNCKTKGNIINNFFQLMIIVNKSCMDTNESKNILGYENQNQNCTSFFKNITMVVG